MGNPIKKYFIIFIVGSGLLGVLVIAIIILPSAKAILTLEEDITSTQEFLEKQYEKSQRLRRSVHEIDDVLEQIADFEAGLIEVGEELTVITLLEQLAENHNITQTLSVDFSDPEETGSVNKEVPAGLRKTPYYTFSFLNRGVYQDQIAFLQSLEKLPYIFLIPGIQIQARGGNDGLTTVQFDAALYTMSK